MFIKAIATAAIAASTLFAGASEAQARTCFYVPQVSGHICNSFQGYNRNGHEVYTLGYASGADSSGMDVVCNGSRMVQWRSTSNMTHSYNASLARYFCSL